MVKIWIDAGHGGTDSGAVGNGLQEKNIVVEIARQMNRILVTEYENVETGMTRQTDVFVSLSERARSANTWGADAFVSIHNNSGGGRGFETFRYTGTSGRSLEFQRAVHQSLMSFYGSSVIDRGMKTANLAVLRETSMISVLTENLFMDNVEITKFNDINFLIGVARAHAEGVANFFQLQKKTPSQPQYPPGIFYIETGGYAGPALAEVHEYLFRTGHNFDTKRAVDGSILFLIGPFDTSAENFKDAKTFLDSNGHTNRLITPAEAANWR